ncbi:MAG: GEVED domain-containing protein [Bacteroidota bacterium]
MKIKLLLSIVVIFSLNLISKSSNAQVIGAGYYHSLLVCANGVTKSVGNNGDGQLGDSTNNNTNFPVTVNGLYGIIEIAGGNYHTIALRNDGTVWTWGYNGDGQLGDGTFNSSIVPIQVPSLTGVIAIAAGASHNLAVKSDGTVWAWGSNGNGQLGDGTYNTSSTPVQAVGLTGITGVQAGYYHSVALKNDGTVWSVGYNGDGELGDGTYTTRNSFAQITSVSGITSIKTGGYHNLALKNNETVWAWGYNWNGQLGNGSTTSSPIPFQISTLTGIIEIGVGTLHSFAIKNNGSAWGWGYNYYGQIGDGTNTQQNSPIQIMALTGITKITGGYYHSLALKNDGTFWSWGHNNYGQLGEGTNNDRYLPGLVHDCCSNLPIISLPVYCVAEDTTVLTSSSFKTFKIKNAACGSLIVSNITCSNPAFAVVPTADTISAYDSATVTLHFSPTLLGNNSGTLTIFNNAHDTTLCVSGYATPTPAISVSPLSFNISLGCNDSITNSFLVSNTAGGTLSFHVGPKVKAALIAADAPYLSAVQTKLMNTGLFSRIDVYDAASVTPTLAQLQQYNSVMVWDDWSYADPTTLGNNLADYVDAGGGVVKAMWSVGYADIGGRYNGNYNCIDIPNNWTSVTASLGTIYVPSNPIMQNVASLDCGGYGYRANTFTVNSQATRIVDWSDGIPLVAVRTINAGKSADINMWPVPSDADSYGWISNTDGARLMANTLVYCAGQSGLSSVNPSSGYVNAGNSATISIKFSSIGINAGVYHDTLLITSNDPNNPVVTFPCTVTINGTAHLQYSLFNTSSACLNLDSIMTNTISFDSISIANSGCDTLQLLALGTSPTQYTVVSSPTLIVPGGTGHVVIKFSPFSSGTFAGTLSLHTNIGDTTICLTGKAYQGPAISINPSSFNVTLGCGDTLISSLLIINSGGLPLNWNGGISTNSPTGYCAPSYTYGCTSGDYINRFTFNTLSKINSGCNGQSNNFIYDQSVTTTVQPGGTYALTMQSGSSWGQGFGVWIDYNQNGSYADVGEFVYASPNSSTGLYSTTITIPSNAHTGKTRIRVRCSFGSTVGAGNYCSNFTYGETEEYDIKIGSGAFSTTPSYGTINSGGSQSVDVKLDSRGLTAGVYSNQIVINSNDPSNPTITVPLTLNVVGAAHMQFTLYNTSLPCLNLDSIMNYTSSKDSLLITNTGCDTLLINSTNITPAQFTVVSSPSYIIPGATGRVIVKFSPTVAGTFNGELTFHTNVLDTTICLIGKAYSAPTITSSPTTFNVSLACNDTLSLPLQITNAGGSTLNYTASIPSSLPRAASCSPLTNGTCCNMGIYNVTFGAINNTTGNATEGYRNYTSIQSTIVNIGQTYTLSVQTGNQYNEYVSAWIDYNDDGIFQSGEMVMNGNLNSLPNRLHIVTVTIPSSAVKNKAVRMRVGSEYSGYSAPLSCNNVQYGQFEDYTINIAPSVYLSSYTGSIGAGNSNSITTHFSSAGLIAGVYTGNITFSSNDPINNPLLVPYTITVSGDGTIALTKHCFNIDSIMQNTTHQDSLYIRNPGCDTLHVTNITHSLSAYSVNQTVFNIAPNDSAKLRVTFAPTTVGTFIDTLNILNNDITQLVCLSDKAYAMPTISTNPTSINVTLSCGDSTTTNLAINNTGAGVLNWSATGGGSVLLPSGYCLPTMYPSNGYSYINSVTTSGGTVNITTPVDAGFTGNVASGVNYYPSAMVSQEPGSSFTLTVQSQGGGGYAYISVWVDWNRNGVFDSGELMVNNVYTGTNLTNFTINVPLGASFGVTRMRIIDWTNGGAPAPCGGLSSYYGEAEDYLVRIGSTGLMFSPTSGTIASNSSQTVSLHMNSLGLNNGVYNYQITIPSNDPLNPSIMVPVTMNVVGMGHIAVTKTCLNHDSIMQYTNHKDSLYIKNIGCDTLHITNITHQLSVYSLNQTTFNILPGDSVKLIATFAPTIVGTFIDSLTILNNDTPVRICLSGKAWAMPTITITPDTINITLSCGDSLSYPLVINNTGGSVLNWNASAGSSFGSPPSGYCIPTMYPSNGYAYINSVTTSGGYVNITTPLDAGFTSNAGAGVNYYPSVMVSQAPGASFTLSLQSQGSGGYSYISVWVDWNRNGVFDATERMVNNVYTSNVLTNFIINVPISASLGVTRMRIIDWSNGSAPAPCGGLSGYYGEEEDYLVSVGSPGLSLGSNSGTINTSSNQTIQLNFNSLGLNNGVYYYPITITSNDPLHPSLTVPATMNVIGVGHIGVSQNCLNLDSIMQYTSHRDSIYIKNTGCDILNVTNITTQTALYTVSNTLYAINPGDSAKLYVSFNPIAVGTFRDTITIFNSDVTKKVCLTGKGFARPIISFSPLSFNVNLSCSDSIFDTLQIHNNGGSNLFAQFSGTGSAKIKVALIGADNTGEINDVQSKLMVTGRFTAVDIFLGQSVTPTLAQLLQYDAVLAWGDYNFANPTLLGNNLADYVDAGGGLVTGVFAVGGANGIAGRYSTGHYWCISNTSGYLSSGQQSLGTVYQTGHPIMHNVNSFNGGTSSFRANTFNVDAGATRIADWTDGRPLVATKTFGSSRVVDLGMFPPSNSVYGSYWVNTTDGATLMANALFYSANTGVSWMTMTPHADTTSAGSTSNVLVGFNSTGLTVGTYNANIYVSSNDPLSPLDTIPVTLHVNGTSIINLSVSCLNMDSIMTYTTSTHSLTIQNTGCDTLRITNITNQQSAYSVNHTTYTILPGGSASLQVTFAPITAGTYLDTLTFINNNVVQHVCLHGIAYPKPVQCHSPNSLNVHFTICQDSVPKQINVCNTNGGSNLNWNLTTIRGNCATFDGNGDYINRGTVNLPTGSVMTAEAWIYPVAYPDATYNGVVCWGPRYCYGSTFLLSIQSNGRPSMATWCNDFVPNSGPTAVLNQWNHIACVLNGTSVTLYINGVPISGTLASTPNVQSSNLAIGSTDYGGRYFNGKIDEVKIYNYALTPAQILNSMNNESTGNESGLSGYWNFNNGTAQDLSSFGNNGTLIGNTFISAPNAPVYSNTVTFNTSSGSTVAGGSSNVTAMFHKAGQSPGTHNFSIYVNSNDPLNSIDTIPVTMTIDSIAPNPPVSANVSECFGNPIPTFTATANSGDTIKWYNSSMVLQHIGSPFNAGQTAVGLYTYYVTATDSLNGCESRKDTVSLHINSAPVKPTASDQSVCFGNDIPALTSSGTIQLWYTNPALTNQVHVGSPYNTGVTAAGTYTYYVSDSTIGCPKSPADTVTLTIHALPSKPVATDVSSCFGSSTPSLTAVGTGSDTIKWYTSAMVFIQNGNPLVTGLSSPGVYHYYVTQTDSLLGCISPKDTATLTIHFTPQPAANNQTACFGGSAAVLTASGSNLKWYNTSMTLVYSGNPYNTGLTAVGVDTFYVTQTLNGCESSSKMVILTINPIPSTPVAADHTICFEQTTPLLTTIGTNVQWYSNAALTSLVHGGTTYNTGLTAVGNYTFYVIQSALGCASHSDTVHLNIEPLPARPLTVDQNACFGYPIPNLVASSTGSDSVTWYTDASLTTLIHTGNLFNTGETTIGTYTYYVIQKDSLSGCISHSDTAHLFINSTPTQPIANDVNACFGQSIPSLTSTGTIIQWYNDSLLTNVVHIGGTYNTGITAVGSYIFYVKDSTAGCSSSIADTAVLTIYPIPNAPTTSGSASICFGQGNPTFSATGTNVNWYSNVGLTNLVHSGSTFTPLQTAAGVYTFYVTQTVNGCSSPATTVVFTINYTPPVVVNNVSVAFGSATPNLIATGSNINWYDNTMTLVSTGNTFTTGETAIGAYTYYVTQTLNGCTSNPDTVTLTIHPLAPAAPNQVVCFGNTIPDLNATGTNINWYSNSQLTTLLHSGSNYTTGQTAVGVYTYYATQTVNGISSQATTASLTINAIPNAPSSINQSACFGGTITSLSAIGTNIHWYDTTFLVHAGSPFATGNTTVGAYYYNVTQTVNGCESPSRVDTLTIHSLPLAPVASDASSCFGDATPNLSAIGTNIKWYNSASILVSSGNNYSTGITAPGVYNYYATQTSSVTGCESSFDSVTLTINFTPLPIANNIAVCEGNSVPTLSATGSSIKWYDNTMTLVYSGNNYNTGLTAAGVYTFYVSQTSSSTGCESAKDTVTLTITAYPNPPIASNVQACSGQTIPSLTAVGASINWYADSSLSAVLANGNSFNTGNTLPGHYTYYVTQTINGCQGLADSVSQIIFLTPSAPLGSGNSAICFGQPNPSLSATGNNLNWYSDSALDTLINTGSSFNPMQTAPGAYYYYITQSSNGCISATTIDTLNIHFTPVVVVSDVSVQFGNPTPSLVASGTNIQWYDTSMVVLSNNSSFATGETAIGVYTYYVSQTQNNCESYLDTVALTIYPNNPVAASHSICLGDIVPDLSAQGNNIRWYSDSLLTNLVYSGSPYITSYNTVGNYPLYVTQTVNGIQSTSTYVTLAINSIPLAPVSSNASACFNSAIPNLTAAGASIQWYNTSTLVASGNSFVTNNTAAGTYVYNVTQTVNGCESPYTVDTLTIHNLPATPLASSPTICFGVATPDLNASGTNIIWRDASATTVSTGNSYVTGITAPGVHTFYATDLNVATGCESAVDTVLLTINFTPPPTAADVSICRGTAPVITASGTNIQWYDASLTSIYNGNPFTGGDTTAGVHTYYVTQTNSLTTCESSKDTVTLTINTAPLAPVASDLAVCYGQSVPALSVVGTNTNWYGSSQLNGVLYNGNTFATNDTTIGSFTYFVTQTVGGCEGPADSVTLTIHSIPASPVLSGNAPVCFGSTNPTFTAIGTNINWFSDASLSTLLANTNNYISTQNSAGTYSYYATQSNSTTGCVSHADSLLFTIHALPIVSANATATDVCDGSPISLTGGGANTYSWTNGVSDGISFVPLSSLTYTVTGTDNNGCENTSTVSINVNALPVVTANSSASVICVGDSIQLHGGGANTYTWTGGVSDSVFFTPTSSSTYTVTGNSGLGCSNTATVSITVNALPTVSASASTTSVCAGAAVTLNGNGAVNYSWNNGITDGVTFVPSSSATYLVNGTDNNGCSNSDSIHINVNALPIVTANSTALTVCVGSSLSLTGGGAATYAWTSGVQDGVAFTPSTSSNYTVVGTDVNGCVDSAIINIAVNNLPIVSANASAASVCAGSSLIMYGTGANAYTWTNGVMDSIAYSPVASGSYIVTGTDVNGCSDTSSIYITVNALPFVTAHSSASAVCEGTSLFLYGSGTLNYQWTGGANDSVVFVPISSATYTVTGTDALGCTNTDTINIVVNPLPATPITNDVVVCSLATIPNLTASGANVQWYDATMVNFYTGNSFATGQTQPGTYTYYVKDINTTTGCMSAMDSVVLSIKTSPPVPVANDLVVCFGNPTTTLYSTGTNISWYLNANLTGLVHTGTSFNTGQTAVGTYTYYITDSLPGCLSPSFDSVSLIINSAPSVPVANDVTICYGQNSMLTTTGNNPHWYSDYTLINLVAIGNNYTPPQTGVGNYPYYVVDFSGGCGNSATDTTHLVINPNPLVTTNVNSIAIMNGNHTTLTAYNASTYAWSPSTGLNATTGATVIASPTVSTTYTVTGTNDYGCSNTTTVFVEVDNVGIDEATVSIADLNIYPNPAIDEFSIEFSTTLNSPIEINLYNTLGQKIWAKTLDGVGGTGLRKHKLDVNTSTLAAGFYSIELTTTEGSISRKLVIVK